MYEDTTVGSGTGAALSPGITQVTGFSRTDKHPVPSRPGAYPGLTKKKNVVPRE